MTRHKFVYSHNLLDVKINSVLCSCHDQGILNSVQAIIQNMIASEDTSQQQLHYLQSCGFGGLWRFAGPYTNVSKYVICKWLPRELLIELKVKKKACYYINTLLSKTHWDTMFKHLCTMKFHIV